jgi:hypothetical protein
MKVTVLYTGPDQHSYFKDLDIDSASKNPLGTYSPAFPVNALTWRTFEAHALFPQHTAPQAQWIIYQQGQVKITTSQGEIRVFGPGDMLLVLDTTGFGHITQTLTAGTSAVTTARLDHPAYAHLLSEPSKSSGPLLKLAPKL